MPPMIPQANRDGTGGSLRRKQIRDDQLGVGQTLHRYRLYRIAMNVDDATRQIDLPDLGNFRFGVELQRFSSIKSRTGAADFDHLMKFMGNGVLIVVALSRCPGNIRDRATDA